MIYFIFLVAVFGSIASKEPVLELGVTVRSISILLILYVNISPLHAFFKAKKVQTI